MAWESDGRLKLPQTVYTSMCRHIYDRHIVECDVKQQMNRQWREMSGVTLCRCRSNLTDYKSIQLWIADYMYIN